MGKNCCYNGCKNDSRAAHRSYMKGVAFFPFPKPKKELEKCQRWIDACGRPDFLRIDNISKHRHVCSEHFVGSQGPTIEWPDPMVYHPTKYMIDPRESLNGLSGTLSHFGTPLSTTMVDSQKQSSYKMVLVGVRKSSTSQSNISIIADPSVLNKLGLNSTSGAGESSSQTNYTPPIPTGLLTTSGYGNKQFHIDNSPQPVKMEVIEEVLPDDSNSMDHETSLGILKQIDSSCARKLIASESDLAMKEFQNVSDVYTFFLRYQVSFGIPFYWTVSRNSESDSVLIYNTNKVEEIDYLTIEVNSDLHLRVKVYGKFLNDDHWILQSDDLPRPARNMFELTRFLLHIRSFKLCSGIDDIKMEELSNAKLSISYLNKYTRAIHSNNCESLHNLKICKRCKCCTTFIRSIKRYDQVKSKTETVKRKRSSNVHYMQPAEIEQLFKARDDENEELRIEVCKLKIMKQKLLIKAKKNFSLAKIQDANLSEDNILQRIVKVQLNCHKLSKKRPAGWDPVLIRWCINLYRTSSAAYEAMKRVFILPAPRTLSNYSSDFPSERGLSNRIISELKQKIDIDKLKDQERYFSLIIVDMKVYPSYSRSKVDCDNEEESRSYLSESWVMVLMVQGLMTILKHVLAYFPCYQMEPNVRFKLIQDSIELLENNGFKILNVICDCSEVYQNVVNLSTDSEIGYAVSFKQRNPFTAQNDRRDIFYIYDPTQLIKLVRNSLYNSGANNFTFFLQKNGKFILWPHIREVFKKDKDSSVRLCPKLTENHIKLTSPYSSQVNLAVQVLSNSVAIAIEMLMGDETTETAKFIRYFNRFFDMLNSKNCSTNKPLDRNFDLDSYTTLDDWRFKWLEEEFLGYLLEWQKETLEADVLPLEKMKMFFTDDILHPIITTVYSIKESVKFLLSKGAISVATEMFNRDVVEERYGRFYRCDNS